MYPQAKVHDQSIIVNEKLNFAGMSGGYESPTAENGRIKADKCSAFKFYNLH
jgi:hypothetical protein